MITCKCIVLLLQYSTTIIYYSQYNFTGVYYIYIYTILSYMKVTVLCGSCCLLCLCLFVLYFYA